jgi:hypothetical protein
MNFTDATTDTKVGTKPAARKANDEGETPSASKMDQIAMDSAKKANSRTHANEQTNSSNTTFSK